MGYIDADGNVYENDTRQDRLLAKLYGSEAGRRFLKLLTRPFISKIGGYILDSRISRLAIGPFIRNNNIDMDDYIGKYYKSFNDFFVRRMLPGRRVADMSENVLISPCDGKLSVYKVSPEGTFNIKNTPYTVKSLLRDKKLADKYVGGYCMVIRLCVDNYHRYCYVADGYKTKNRRINGVLHTVNPIASCYYPIYKENAREYSMLRTKQLGDIIQMEVGALFVGKIVNHDEKKYVHKCHEKGFFEFGGSTIVLLVEKDKLAIDDRFILNTSKGLETCIKQGETLGICNSF